MTYLRAVVTYLDMQESDFFLSRPIPDRVFLAGLKPEFITPDLFPMLVKNKTTKGVYGYCSWLFVLSLAFTVMQANVSFSFLTLFKLCTGTKAKVQLYSFFRKKVFPGISVDVLTQTEDL